MNANAKREAAPAVPARRSPVGWILGWVMVPALVLGGIFGAGVCVGANLHESWVARSVMWFAGLFG